MVPGSPRDGVPHSTPERSITPRVAASAATSPHPSQALPEVVGEVDLRLGQDLVDDGLWQPALGRSRDSPSAEPASKAPPASASKGGLWSLPSGRCSAATSAWFARGCRPAGAGSCTWGRSQLWMRKRKQHLGLKTCSYADTLHGLGSPRQGQT